MGPKSRRRCGTTLSRCVVAQAPDCDWPGSCATSGLPSTPCRQYGSSTQEDPRPPSRVRRLIDANGGLALFRRICHIPVPGPHAPLLRPLPSPNDGRASSSGSVDTGGGGSPPCSPGSSGPSESSSTSSPCGTDVQSSSGGLLPSASPPNLPRPDRVLPLTTAVATTTAGAPTAASSRRVPNPAPSAGPNQYPHPATFPTSGALWYCPPRRPVPPLHGRRCPQQQPVRVSCSPPCRGGVGYLPG